MLQFESMFPGASPQLIESVLRKHDGDVSETIDELLHISADNSSALPTTSSSQAFSDDTQQITQSNAIALAINQYKIVERFYSHQKTLLSNTHQI